MRKRRLRAATESTNDAGFTLLELLVVLALVGLLLAATPALIASARPGTDVRAAAQELANGLRAARGSAIVGDQTTWFVLDPSNKTYMVEPGGGVRRLQTGSRVDVSGPGEISFFPDGSSSGGQVHLTARNQARWVTVQALTGRIAVHE